MLSRLCTIRGSLVRLFFLSKKREFFSRQTFNRTLHVQNIIAKVLIFWFPHSHGRCSEYHRSAVDSDMHSWSEAHANTLHVVGMMRLPEVTVCLLPRCLRRTPRITLNQLTMTSFFLTCVRRDKEASAHICLVLTPHAVIRRPMQCKYLERLKDN